MMEHTPGPWKYVKQGPHWNNPALERIEIQHGNDGECIADTVYEEADARFIVTACNNFEEMYEALKKIQRYLDIVFPSQERARVAKINALLARIEGER